MYSALPYAFAQVAIEIIHNVIETSLYCVIVFSMMGFEWTATKFIYFYYFMLMCFIYITLFGMMLIALTPNHQIGAIVISSFSSLWNLFAGFLIPRTVM